MAHHAYAHMHILFPTLTINNINCLYWDIIVYKLNLLTDVVI